MNNKDNPRRYRVVLLGFGYLALGLLKGLLGSGNCEVVGVFPWSRCVETGIRDVGEEALIRLVEQYGLPLLSCKSINGFDFAAQLERLSPDLVLIGSWGEIIRPHLLGGGSGPVFVNCHPSLLPAHRGPNPYVTVIREGERETGITFHFINDGIDTGPVLLQQALPILDHDTGGSLRVKCAGLAEAMAPALIGGLLADTLRPVPQNEALASYYQAFEVRDGVIDWNRRPADIVNQVRAYQPWMDSYSFLEGRQLVAFRELRTGNEAHEGEPGMILDAGRGVLKIASARPDQVLISEQYRLYVLAGYLPVTFSRFIAGTMLRAGQRFVSRPL